MKFEDLNVVLGEHYYGETPPKNPQIGDRWTNTKAEEMFVWEDYNGNPEWIKMESTDFDFEGEITFNEYLENNFNLTKQELIDLLKEHKPECLI